MGVVFGMVMSYKFGTNWSVFSDMTGPVLGPLMGYDVLTKEGVDVLLFYGDPAYYRRFGFLEKTGPAFIPPYPLKYPFG